MRDQLLYFTCFDELLALYVFVLFGPFLIRANIDTVVSLGDLLQCLASWNAVKTAWMIGDIDAAQKHFSAEFESFEADGSLLSPLDFEAAKAAFAAGLKFNVQSAHSEVTVYGDAAILTEYHTRQLTPRAEPLSA